MYAKGKNAFQNAHQKVINGVQKTGTVSDKRHGNPGGPRTSRTDDSIGEVETFRNRNSLYKCPTDVSGNEC